MTEKIILWNKNLSVGIKDIDNQHKHFIGIINSVYAKINNIDEKRLSEDLNELIEYARIHFTTEEDYFKKWDYPDAKKHMAEHEKLTLKVLKFKDKFDRNEKIMEELINFLKDWLENHLKTYDFKYRDYAKERGLD